LPKRFHQIDSRENTNKERLYLWAANNFVQQVKVYKMKSTRQMTDYFFSWRISDSVPHRFLLQAGSNTAMITIIISPPSDDQFIRNIGNISAEKRNIKKQSLNLKI
jgi:hypothetical protein